MEGLDLWTLALFVFLAVTAVSDSSFQSQCFSGGMTGVCI